LHLSSAVIFSFWQKQPQSFQSSFIGHILALCSTYFKAKNVKEAIYCPVQTELHLIASRLEV